MKIKSGFELMDVLSEHVIVAYGEENINFSKVISLNESAAYVWENVIGKEFDAKTVADLLLQEYEVEEQTAIADATALIDIWKDNGLVE